MNEKICRLDLQCKVNKCKENDLNSILDKEFFLKQIKGLKPEKGMKCACSIYLHYNNEEEIKDFVSRILDGTKIITIKKNYKKQRQKNYEISSYAC